MYAVLPEQLLVQLTCELPKLQVQNWELATEIPERFPAAAFTVFAIPVVSFDAPLLPLAYSKPARVAPVIVIAD